MEDHIAKDPEVHEHSMECGHTKILHNGHIDVVEPNGHLHHRHGDHWDECRIEVSDKNPDAENPVPGAELHNDKCGHQKIAHGDHYDYLVNGRLQHVHGDHVDDHGPVTVLK